jgi:hypothetical protein
MNVATKHDVHVRGALDAHVHLVAVSRQCQRRRFVTGQVWRRRVEPHVAPHNIGEGKKPGVLEVARRPRLVARDRRRATQRPPESSQPRPVQGNHPEAAVARDLQVAGDVLQREALGPRRRERRRRAGGDQQAGQYAKAHSFVRRPRPRRRQRADQARKDSDERADGRVQRNAAPDPAEERHRDAEERVRDLDPDDERHRPQRCHE